MLMHKTVNAVQTQNLCLESLEVTHVYYVDLTDLIHITELLMYFVKLVNCRADWYGARVFNRPKAYMSWSLHHHTYIYS